MATKNAKRHKKYRGRGRNVGDGIVAVPKIPRTRFGLPYLTV